jgi:HEAT repeat protein
MPPDDVRQSVFDPYLLTLTNARSPEALISAIQASGQSRVTVAVPYLIDLLNNELIPVRAAAAEALGQIGHPDAESALLWMLEHEPDKAVHTAVIKAAGLLQSTAAVDSLLGALDDVALRAAAIEALGWIGDPGAVEPLSSLIFHQVDKVRQYAVDALGDIGDARAVTELVQCLQQDTVMLVRRSAARALGKLNDVQAVAPLIQALWSEDEIIVQWQIVHALEQIGDDQGRAAAAKWRTEHEGTAEIEAEE